MSDGQKKIYKITIEAIGEEEEKFRPGFPKTIECVGFGILAKLSETEEGIASEMILHEIGPKVIAKMLYNGDNTQVIGSLMMMEKLKEQMGIDNDVIRFDAMPKAVAEHG